MTEVIETVMPFGYLACFVTNYYGPNSEILGNIRNSYWQNQGVEDVNAAISNLLILVFVDTLSLIISAIILWQKYRLNLVKVSKTTFTYHAFCIQNLKF